MITPRDYLPPYTPPVQFAEPMLIIFGEPLDEPHASEPQQTDDADQERPDEEDPS